MRGQVTDTTGAAVAGATVVVTDPAKGTSRSVTTDENGVYIVLALLPSTYSMKVEAGGFASRTFNDIKLEVGQVATFAVQLTAGGVQATIEITSGSETLEVERTAQSSVIGVTQITNPADQSPQLPRLCSPHAGVTDSNTSMTHRTSELRIRRNPARSFGATTGVQLGAG